MALASRADANPHVSNLSSSSVIIIPRQMGFETLIGEKTVCELSVSCSPPQPNRQPQLDSFCSIPHPLPCVEATSTTFKESPCTCYSPPSSGPPSHGNQPATTHGCPPATGFAVRWRPPTPILSRAPCKHTQHGICTETVLRLLDASR